MPFKPPPAQPDFSSLFTSLSNSKLQKDNYALYQTIFLLIQSITQSRDIVVDDIEELDQDVSIIYAADFLMSSDQSANFPNSRELLPGTNVTFDDSVANERTINVASAAIGAEWSVLTNGDATNPELIFAAGDVIMTHIP